MSLSNYNEESRSSRQAESAQLTPLYFPVCGWVCRLCWPWSEPVVAGEGAGR